MTKNEAAELLIEGYAGSPGQMRSRRSKARRKKLLEGDHTTIRAMLLTASPKSEPTPPELLEAVAVLTTGNDATS